MKTLPLQRMPLKTALIGLVGAAAVVSVPGQAQAANPITLTGQTPPSLNGIYTINFVNGNWNTVGAQVIAGSPWWGNTNLASTLAVALNNSPTPVGGSFVGNNFTDFLGTSFNSNLLFADAISGNTNFILGTTALASTSFMTTGSFVVDKTTSYNWAVATKAPLPGSGVPAPLPVFGAAAAFGFSRRLRTRINKSATA